MTQRDGASRDGANDGIGDKSVVLTGNGSVSGGVYRKIKIVGESQIHGDTECGEFSCTGMCQVAGALSARLFRLRGEVGLEGALKAEQINVMGQTSVQGSMQGGVVKVRGMLRTQGNCEAEQMSIGGAVEVGGLLSADKLDISLYGPNRAKEVGGGQVTIRRRPWMALKQWLSMEGPAEFRADTIEGDDIRLEHTYADTVRGATVRIGPGCRIGLVEYREQLLVDKHAEVKESRQV